MMKLSLTVFPFAAGVVRGSGVARASGGCTSSHDGRELTCGTDANCEARFMEPVICNSRWDNDALREMTSADVAANATVDIRIIKVAGQLRRTIISYPRNSS